MFQFPMKFYAQSAVTEFGKPWPVSSGEHSTTCSIPPEFKGPGGGFSPEDFYAQALTNCFTATFQVYAMNSKVHYQGLHVKAELTVDLDEQKRPWMQSCQFKIEIQAAENPDRARALVEKTFKSGFILNSVKTQLTYELLFS